MLAAVSSTAPGYEGLGGYFLGGQKRGAPPASVPGAGTTFKSPRLPTTPGATVPGAPTPIPTSSQKPTQNTNVRIPYARCMFTSPLDDAAPRDLQRGDVVFAHRQSLAMGRGANRLVKCTGLPQLNEMLQRGGTSDGNGDRSGCLDLRVRAVRERVKAARIRHYEGELARAERDVDDLARRVQTPALRDASARAALALFSARGRLEEAKQFDPAVDMPEPAATDYDFAADAAAVPLLRDWTLDGVLINVDDDVLDVETPHDARNDGLLLNVAIAGPTPLRNAARTVGAAYSNQLLPRNGWTPQVVDDTPMALDCIVALLVGEPVMLNAGDDPSNLNRPRYYRFHWQLGSLRQWYNITAGGNGGGFGAGLSRDDVARNWGAYRIGCVTDRNLVAEPDEDRQLMLNVTVEWLGPEPLLRRADAEAAELVQALVNDAARNARRQQRRRLPPGPVPDAPDGGGPIDGARGQLLNTTLASLERGVAHERLPHAASVNLLR